MQPIIQPDQGLHDLLRQLAWQALGEAYEVDALPSFLFDLSGRHIILAHIYFPRHLCFYQGLLSKISAKISWSTQPPVSEPRSFQ